MSQSWAFFFLNSRLNISVLWEEINPSHDPASCVDQEQSDSPQGLKLGEDQLGDIQERVETRHL